MDVTDRLLRIEEVSAKTGVPAPTLRYWRHKGLGPPAGKLGKRLVWIESEVDAWVKEQLAASKK